MPSTRRTTFSLMLTAALATTLGPVEVQAADVTGFRDSGGLAHSKETGLPVTWSSSQNVVWKAKMPGPGTSSPIVLGERIYLTSYTGYGLVPNQGEQANLKRQVLCLDRASGKQIWRKEFAAKLPESRYSGGNNARHGFASATPTTDGKHIYVFFGKSGVFCFDLDGKTVWTADVGSRTRGWGSSNSPVLHKNLVIINASVESGRLLALDKATGKEAWTVGGIRGSWNTPLLAEVPGGGTELVISVPQQVRGLDPATGKQLWTCQGIPDRGYVCPSVVADKGVVYAIGGRQNTALAIKLGGRGDVTSTHLLWTKNRGSNVSSPVVADGRLYWFHERRGTAYCLDAKSGDIVYEARLAPRPGLGYSSMLFADGKLYCISQHNGTYVVATGSQFKLLAHNTFADDDSRTNACPVAHNGQLLLRTDGFLYCLGNRK